MWCALLALLFQAADFQADGLKALDAKQYDSAVELFTKAVAADSKDYAPRFYLGLAYSMLGKDAEAVPNYKGALELKPRLYEAEINLGISLLKVKDPEAAIPYLKDAAEQKPKELQPQYYLGAALLEKGRLDEAEAAFAAALALDAKSAPSELGLGRTLARKGKIDEADPHFRKAASLDSSYQDSLLELASALESNHQGAKAIEIYKQFPDNPGAAEHVGALLLETGHADEAIPVLEKVVAGSPTPANRLALAQALIDNKQPDKATPILAQVVASEPNDYRVRMFYGRVLRDEHKYSGAVPQFSAAAQVKPDSVEAWNELSAALILDEQYPQALAALDRVRALGAETSAHYFFRAMALDRLHQLKEALANYNKFLEMDQGKSPDEEFKARQRAKTIQNELNKR